LYDVPQQEQLLHIPSWSWHKTGGDEVICISELKMGLMAQNCLAPGIVTLLSNLLFMRSVKVSFHIKQYSYGVHKQEPKVHNLKIEENQEMLV